MVVLFAGCPEGGRPSAGLLRAAPLTPSAEPSPGGAPSGQEPPPGRSPPGIESRGHGRASPSGLVLPTLLCPLRYVSEGRTAGEAGTSVRNARQVYLAGIAAANRIPAGSGDDCHGGRSQRYVRTTQPARPSPVGTSGNRNRTRRAAVGDGLVGFHWMVII